jgi:hypothetical protein
MAATRDGIAPAAAAAPFTLDGKIETTDYTDFTDNE